MNFWTKEKACGKGTLNKPWEMLIEWKEVANFLGVPVETLRWWHKQYLPLPLRKSRPCPQGWVVVSKQALLRWLEMLCEVHPNTYRIKKLKELQSQNSATCRSINPS